MSESPIVSICIPVFNGMQYLRDCLQSAIKQTEESLEIILADDGSNDGSQQIAIDLLEDSERPFRFFQNDRLGIASNCNFLISRAKGKYIKFLFQDDLLEPVCVEKLIEATQLDPRIVLAFSGRTLQLDSPTNKVCRQIYEGCHEIHRHWNNLRQLQEGKALLNDANLLNAPINKIGEPTATLILKDAIQKAGGFDHEFRHLLDLDLWLRIMPLGKVAHIEQSLATFRIHTKQQSVLNIDTAVAEKDTVRLYKKLLTDPAYDSMDSVFKTRVAEKLVLSTVRTHVPEAQLNEALKSLREEQKKNALQKEHLGEEQKKNALQKDELNHAKEKLAHLQVLEKELQAERNNIDIAQQHIDRLNDRIRFLESTLAWKIRKTLMRVYYFFNPSKKASNKSKDPPNKIPPPSLSKDFQGFNPIKFLISTSPQASIVIPVYNQLELTYLCLQSIVEYIGPGLDFEIILIDDCSDDFGPLNDCLEGVNIISNSENEGFIKSCNMGADHAKGEFLVFLNNDTLVTKGWLHELLRTFELEPRTGVAGSKLLYPDGRLQEAGGIIWKDATGCNYGKWDNPAMPQYNFLRETDYCSGASIAIPKQLFDELDGFSEHYQPAYYEDTDLCFRARQAGYKVLYQPASEVIHLEGATSGTSEESGAKAHQKTNREKFLECWRDTLITHPAPGGQFTHQYEAATRHNKGQTILVVDTYVPMYDKESGCQRLFHLLHILRQSGHHIIFLPDNGYPQEPYASELRDMGIEVLAQRLDGSPPQDLLAPRLTSVDIAWICRPQHFDKYADQIRSGSSAPIIYDTIDLHFLRVKREWELGGQTDNALKDKWKSYLATEKACAENADLTLTVTEDEAQCVRKWNCRAQVVPNIHVPRATPAPPFEQRQGLLFIGSYNHPPNIDAVCWLCQEILPTIEEAVPGIHVTLLGSTPPKQVSALANDRVSVPGYIHDVQPYFDKARVFVAPLRYGAGMKGKIGQSMELGLPVVTTTIGAEGMGLKHGKDALIANSAQEFAEQVLMLYSQSKTWEEIASNSLRSIKRFSPSCIRKSLENKLRHLTGIRPKVLAKKINPNKTLFIGHSHLQCIREFCTAGRTKECGKNLAFIQLRKEGYIPNLVSLPDGGSTINQTLISDILEECAGNIVAHVWGNTHNKIGLVQHTQPYDFIHPKAKDLPLETEARILPFAQVRETLAKKNERLALFLGSLKNTVEATIHYFESPPPIPSKTHIEKYTGKFTEKIARLGIAPKFVRYKLWKTQCDINQQFCQNLGVNYIRVPHQAVDLEGMLREEFWHVDPSHANPQYGEIAYEHICREIQKNTHK